ncbi:peptidoglycan -binding protein [Roseomonas fluvialis]|uniref:peptidoglycan -binding protein n=1 Tax=Roseomonas fluvialis TaxID=1750527 RepID=UPI001FCCDD9C|nr:peptidoglycan -binding protein [Roseomonas fluvialis]
MSTLLMVIIFVLLVFALAQGFLSVAVSSRDRALDRLNRQVAELAEMLALERGQAEELRGGLSRATEELAAAATARDAAQRSLATLREERDRIATERDGTRAERDRLAARLADLGLTGRGAEERVAALERQLGEALARAEAAGGDAARVARDLTEARRGLAEAEQRRATTERQAGALAAELTTARADLSRVQAEALALDQQMRADRATIEARLADVARLGREVEALTALRDEAERQASAALARAGAQERLRLAAEQAAAQAATATAEVERRRAALAASEQAAVARATEAERARLAAEAQAAEAARLRAAREAEARTAAARALEAESARAAAEAAATRAVAEAAEAARRRAEADGAAAAAASRAGASEAEAQAAARRAGQAETAAAQAAQRAGYAEEQRRLAEAQAAEQVRLAESARAQVALLSRQIEALRADLARLSAALDLAQGERQMQEATIAQLGQRLNAALAQRVEELQRYRSDFFGRLRQVLGERPEVRIVGDRFVFQGEVLFAPASADLSEEGRRQVRDLARVLLEVTPQIPNEIAWVVRVDGHADRSPLRGGRFASNWELAAARAIAVAQLLIAEGLPANRVAATSFGDTQPIDPGEGAAAFARNRRIEVRLTDR